MSRKSTRHTQTKMAGKSRPFRSHILLRLLRLARHRLAKRRLRCGQPRDRHAVGRARNVIEPDLVAERHRSGIAAVLAANADLEIRPRLAAAGDADLDEFADAVTVDR